MKHSWIRRSLIGRFVRHRRGAIALMMAFLLVPMLILAGTAVDFARVSAARTVLQAAVDSAAISGNGDWPLSESSTDAYTIAENAFNGTGATLTSETSPGSTLGTPTVSIALYCSGAASAQQCHGNATTYQAYSTTFPSQCDAGAEYCTVVNASVTVTNSLLYFWIPSELLSATAAASAAFPSGSSNLPDQPAAHNGTAYNHGRNYAYAIPLSGGTSGTPEYGTLPTPNSNCATEYPDPFQYLTSTPAASGDTSCNYQFLSDSLGQGGTATSLTSNANDPIGFAYIDYTGENAPAEMDATHYTTNLMVSTTSATSGYAFYPNGLTIPPTFTTCPKGHTGCTLPQSTVLYGQCPGHDLYGSIYTDQNSDLGTPAVDSIKIFSSAFEELGYPPSYEANHAIVPFVTSYDVHTIGNYYVESVCPNYSTAGTTINAPISNSYVNDSNPELGGSNIFSTWYPTGLANEVAFTDTGASANAISQALTIGNGVYPNDVFPPAVAGCTPATPALDGGVTTAATWWGWSDTTSAATNIGAAYCNPTAPTATPLTAPTLAQAQQSTSYTNCALIIQDLGTSVPQITVNGTSEAQLPDYYNIITSDSAGTNVVALDPVWDNTTYTDTLTGATIVNTDTSGDYPTNAVAAMPVQTGAPTFATSSSPVAISASTKIPFGYTTSGVPATPFAGTQYIGDYLWIQIPALTTPANTYDESLPAFTSHQCYNPQANGTAAGTYSGDNNNGTAVDPVSNPQLGAITCNQPVAHNYGIYWHDMGGFGVDLLGYYNDISVFTCSTPPFSNAGGGGSLLSF